MKTTYLTAALFAMAISMASCDGGSSASSSDCFGDIIATQKNFEEKKTKLEGSMTEDNYKSKQEEIDKLKAESLEKIQSKATEMNGQEVSCEVDAAQLAIEQPVTLVFDEMNNLRPMFKLAGKVIAAANLNLNADPNDLKGEALLSGSKVSVTVTMPVGLDILDKDGNVLHHMDDIGILSAENLTTSAVVKAGTPIEFRTNFAADNRLEGATSFRLTVDLDKAPYTSRSL